MERKWVVLGKGGRLYVSRSKKLPKETYYGFAKTLGSVPSEAQILFTSPSAYLFILPSGREKFMENEYFLLSLGERDLSSIVNGYVEWIRHLHRLNRLSEKAQKLFQRAQKCLSLAERAGTPAEGETAAITGIEILERVVGTSLSIRKIVKEK
jgi:hypothetical protein